MEIATFPSVGRAPQDDVAVILRKCPWGAMTRVDYVLLSTGRGNITTKVLLKRKGIFFFLPSDMVMEIFKLYDTLFTMALGTILIMKMWP